MTNSHAAPAADATTSKHDEQSQSPRPLLLNTLMILALGVGLSGWLLRYTGWFAAFGGLLTLSGVFSWLAVMVKIFPERAFNILQESVYRSLFAKQVTQIEDLRRIHFAGSVLQQRAGNVECRHTSSES